MKKTSLRMLTWTLAALPLMAVAGGAVLSPVADAEVATCANGVIVFDDRPYEMTAAAAERLAGKTFFRRSIEGGFAAEVVKGGELFVVTPTEKASSYLSQGKTLAALGFEKLPGEPFQAFGEHKCDVADVATSASATGDSTAPPATAISGNAASAQVNILKFVFFIVFLS